MSAGAELDGDPYRGVGTILVHPTTLVLEGQRSTGAGGLASSDPYPILGQASSAVRHRCLDTVFLRGRHPARGQNVVYHEFAHKLDMIDGVIDGTRRCSRRGRERWVQVCTREFRALQRGTGGDLLREYGGENPGEFFAVATRASSATGGHARTEAGSVRGFVGLLSTGSSGSVPGDRAARRRGPRV